MTKARTGQASLIGVSLAGYEVLGLIGRGAMGAVYLARDRALNRYVALKVLLGSFARNPTLIKSFHREAQAAAPLRHPGIVRIYSAGIERGTPYIAMEYVEGEPLDRFLRRKGALTWQTSLYILGQVAQALDCAHELGIVHRDVKPGNILLDRQGRVRLTDFGIANIQTEEPETWHGAFVGTPHYMAPEQCAGASVTPASDLFSLGVVAYQMISGQLPFDADSPLALMKRIASDEPPRLNKVKGGIPDDVARLVAHLLQKNPADRPPSARWVYDAIERLQAEKGGRSAISMALAAFIREQAGMTPISHITPLIKAKTAKKPEKRASKGAWIRAATGTLLFTALLLASGLGPQLALAPGEAPPRSAPVMADAVFSRGEGGIEIIRLETPHFRPISLHWAGEEPVFLAYMRGEDGGLAWGRAGILAVNVREKAVYSLQAPREASGSRLVFCAHSIPAAPDGAPLDGMTLMGVSRAERFWGYARPRMAGQRWDEAAPHPLGWPENTGIEEASSVLPVAIHPGGQKTCLLVEQRDGEILVEYNLDPAGPGAPLTGAAPIVDGSVQYSRDGVALFYMIEGQPGKRELWRVDPARGRSSAAPIALGPLEEAYALSPDGELGALSVRHPETNGFETRLIDLRNGAVIGRVGEGRVSAEAWHPSGSFFVLAAADSQGIPQLWAVEKAAPHRRASLTALSEGVSGGGAVSRDGRWAAAPAAVDGKPALILVDLTQMQFKTLAADGKPAHAREEGTEV